MTQLTLGEKLRMARARVDLSREKMGVKLGDYTGTSPSRETLRRWEEDEVEPGPSMIQAIADVSGLSYGWLVGTSLMPVEPDLVTAGDSQRSHHVESVNGHDIAVITKTDEQAAADTFLPRRTFLGGAVKDLRPAPVLSFETPQLALDKLAPEDERWLELLFQKVG